MAGQKGISSNECKPTEGILQGKIQRGRNIRDILCLEGRFAHVFCAEVAEGKARFFDPQTGKDDASNYIQSMKANRVGVIRIDNKLVNPKSWDYSSPNKREEVPALLTVHQTAGPTVEQNKGGKTDRQLKTIPINTPHGIDASLRGTG